MIINQTINFLCNFYYPTLQRQATQLASLRKYLEAGADGFSLHRSFI
jgi:hypothetical protein